MTENKELVSLTFTVNGDRLIAFSNSNGIDNQKDIYHADSAKLEFLLDTEKHCLTKPRLVDKQGESAEDWVTSRVNLPKIG